MQRGVSRSDVTDVALEVLHIDWIEANNGSVEANICFRDVGTKVVWSTVLSEVGFSAVE